jgi:hypothetical protein
MKSIRCGEPPSFGGPPVMHHPPAVPHTPPIRPNVPNFGEMARRPAAPPTATEPVGDMADPSGSNVAGLPREKASGGTVA